MSTQPYEQAIAVSREVLEGVKADQMDNSTPCASWDVSALINHMVGAQGFFKSGLEGSPPGDADTNHAAGDYVAAFDAASAASLAGFASLGALAKTVSLPFGDMPGAAFMGLAINDTFTHAWDLAKATGQDTNLAPELAAGILAQAKMAIQDSFRGEEGAPFGALKECPEGSSAADELAAFLGREV